MPRRSLQVLRDTLNCTLPIEIIYNGPGEMDDWAINKFQARSLRPLMDSQRRHGIHKSSELRLSTSYVVALCSPLWLIAIGSHHTEQPLLDDCAEPVTPCVGCRRPSEM